MKVAMIYPAMVGSLPPLLTASVCMADQGHEITIFSMGCEPEPQNILEGKKVKIIHLGYLRYPRSSIQKAILRFRFAKLLFGNCRANAFDVIWFHTSFAMSYSWIFNGDHVSIAHAHELYSEPRLSKIQNRFIGNEADLLIVPEVNRSWIIRVLARRMDIPTIVVPNRLPESAVPIQSGDGESRALFLDKEGSPQCKKFMIYQGQISEERCILQLIEAFKRFGRNDVGLIILGSGTDSQYMEQVKKLSASSNRIVVAPSIPSPGHLKITQGCDWGVMLYAPKDLNTIYCAPNKIFEFSYFGLGMLMPFYPGLQEILSKYQLGESCDPMNPDSIQQAMKRLCGTESSVFERETKRFLNSEVKPEDIYKTISRKIEDIWKSM